MDDDDEKKKAKSVCIFIHHYLHFLYISVF